METPQIAIVMLFSGHSMDTTITNYYKNRNITLNNKSAITHVSYVSCVSVRTHTSLVL